MKVLITYTALSTKVLFQISKAADEKKGFTLEVLDPQKHTCEKNHKTVLDVAIHLKLSNKAAQVLLMAWSLNEKQGVDSVSVLEFTVTRPDVACEH